MEKAEGEAGEEPEEVDGIKVTVRCVWVNEVIGLGDRVIGVVRV